MSITTEKYSQWRAS